MNIPDNYFIKLILELSVFIAALNQPIQANETDISKEIRTGIKARLEKLPPEPDEFNNGTGKLTSFYGDLDVPENKEVILDIYSVKKGDTLISLARREYGDKDLWKVIYRYNDYINDPHWIFPEDKLIMPRVVSKLPAVPEAEEEPEEEDQEREYNRFLAPLDFEFDGTIIGFKTSKILYAQGDYLFIDIGEYDGVSTGQQLNIYTQGREIYHPDTGAFHGRIVEKIGTVRVTGDIETNSSTARIVYSDGTVEEGYKLLLTE